MSVIAGDADIEVVVGRPVPGTGQGSVSERMDRLPLTWLHIGLVAVGAIGFAFDLLELSLGNVLSAEFSAPPHAVDAVQLSWLLAAMYIGAIRRPGRRVRAAWVESRLPIRKQRCGCGSTRRRRRSSSWPRALPRRRQDSRD